MIIFPNCGAHLLQNCSFEQDNDSNSWPDEWYSYDNLDRLSNISFNGDPTTWAFQYKNNSNRTSAVKNGSETTGYTYDSLNRVTRIDFPSIAGKSQYVEYQYNPVGQVLNIKNSPLASDPVIFAYDPGGLNVSVTGPNNNLAAFMYDEEGRRNKSYYADAVSSNMNYISYRNYDSVGHIVRLRTENQKAQVLVDLSYTYDKNGNRTQEKDELSGSYTVYGYDNTSQLVTEKYYNSSSTLTKQINC